jgi:hypothetical protein
MSSPPSRSLAPSCRVAQAAGSSFSGLALTPGSDPEPASSFLREASSRRSGHPVCGPWRSAAKNWRWPRLSCQAQQARTPGRPVRAKRGHATLLARSDSAFFIACRGAFVVCPGFSAHTYRPGLAPPYCSKLDLNSCSAPAVQPRPNPVPHAAVIGVLERFHLTLKTEEVYWRFYENPQHARACLMEFRVRYNTLRPH